MSSVGTKRRSGSRRSVWLMSAGTLHDPPRASSRRMVRRLLLACVALAAAAHAAPLPRAGERIPNGIRAGYTETIVADSLDSPVSMAIAPDGRVFVCEQGGRLRVIRNGKLV